jgi:RNA polymerase sigma-70 factor (ECF subfamily)
VRHPHFDQLAVLAKTAAPTPESSVPPDELKTLVTRAQGGDLEAQSELVRRYARRIAGQVSVIVRQPSVVEDIAQVVFIKMVRTLPWLREIGAFEPWLFMLSRTVALDYVRKQKRRPTMVPDEFELANAPDTGSELAVAEIREALDRALARLSAKDRNLVTMLVDGHNYRTLAEEEGLTVGAVKARLSRIRSFLRVAVGVATGTRLPSAEEVSARPRCRLAA